MNNSFLLTPSIYCADTANLQKEISKLKAIGINWIHFDVMDGHFVKNYALSPKELNDIKTYYPELIVDVHVMATDLTNKIELFRKANYLTFHLNSIKNKRSIIKLITEIKKYNIKVGIALDLEDDISEIKKFLEKIDLVTFMAIKPGFTGQTFNPSVWKKLQQIKNLKQKYPHLLIQIDGGVRWDNILMLIEHGIDLIVVGSLLFKEKNYQFVIDRLSKLVNQKIELN